MDMCSVILHVFSVGVLSEETPCEHGENMQTPHRKALKALNAPCVSGFSGCIIYFFCNIYEQKPQAKL